MGAWANPVMDDVFIETNRRLCWLADQAIVATGKLVEESDDAKVVEYGPASVQRAMAVVLARACFHVALNFSPADGMAVLAQASQDAEDYLLKTLDRRGALGNLGNRGSLPAPLTPAAAEQATPAPNPTEPEPWYVPKAQRVTQRLANWRHRLGELLGRDLTPPQTPPDRGWPGHPDNDARRLI